MTMESKAPACGRSKSHFGRLLAIGLLAVLTISLAVAFSMKPAFATSDLHILRDGLCDAEIVLLGELPSHGESRAFVMKAELIDQLIEHCGFDALLFEAPFYEFALLHERLLAGDAHPEQLDDAIGGFWNGPALADWRSRWFELAATGRLQLGGLDDQISASSVLTRQELPDRVVAWLPPDRKQPCRQALDRHLHWTYDEGHPFDAAERSALSQCASEALVGWQGAVGEQERAMLDALRRLFARQAGEAVSADRGRSMFERLAWFRSRFAGRKLLVWTATVHAAGQAPGRPHRPLGDLARERWGDAVMSVGWTAASGYGAMAGGPVYPIPPAPEGSLEDRAMEAAPESRRVLLDRQALERMGSIESRLMGSFRAGSWGEAFDFVVVIREESAP